MSNMTAEPANPLEVRMARLEGSYEQIDRRLSSLESQITEIRGDIRGFRADVDTKLNSLQTVMFSGIGLLALLITVFEFIR